MSCQTVTEGLSSHVKHHRFMPTAEYRTDNNPRLATRSRRRETIQVNDLLNVIQSYLPALPLKVSDKLKKKKVVRLSEASSISYCILGGSHAFL